MARRPHKNSGANANATSTAAVGFDAKLWATTDGLRNNIDAGDCTDVPSCCTCAALEAIRKHAHALTPGRCIGAQNHGRDWYSYVRCESVNIEWRGAIGARA
jgi:hypothetical protein